VSYGSGKKSIDGLLPEQLVLLSHTSHSVGLSANVDKVDEADTPLVMVPLGSLGSAIFGPRPYPVSSWHGSPGYTAQPIYARTKSVGQV
jgi:hypothetical protein